MAMNSNVISLQAYRPTPPKPKPQPQPMFGGEKWHQPLAKWCLEQADSLNMMLREREREFLASMAEWDRPWPTERQGYWLESIEKRVRQRLDEAFGIPGGSDDAA
jgi:hypothetical protein